MLFLLAIEILNKKSSQIDLIILLYHQSHAKTIFYFLNDFESARPLDLLNLPFSSISYTLCCFCSHHRMSKSKLCFYASLGSSQGASTKSKDKKGKDDKKIKEVLGKLFYAKMQHRSSLTFSVKLI